MKSKIKISLAILGIANISIISVTSIVSCSNNSSQNQNNSNASNNSTPSDTNNNWANGVSYTPYTSLSEIKIIDNPSTKKQFTNYQAALANWTSTYNSLIKTNSQYEAAVKSALYSFLKNNNNRLEILTGNPFIAVGSTNYYEAVTTIITNFQVSFAANNYVNINCKFNSMYYLINPNNTSQKYLVYETKNTFSIISKFTPCLSLLYLSYFYNNYNKSVSSNWYGAISFNDVTNVNYSSTQLDNKALILNKQPYYMQKNYSKSSKNRQLLENIINDSSLPLQPIENNSYNFNASISDQGGNGIVDSSFLSDDFIYTYLGSWNYGTIYSNND